MTIGGQVVKDSRDLRPGDVIEVVRGELRLRLKVLGAPTQRLGPPRVAEFCENLTPAEWFHKASEARREKKLITPPEHEQITKPNKKQLRELRDFWHSQQE